MDQCVVVWMRVWLFGRGVCCSLDEEVVISGSDCCADATCLSSSSDLVCPSAGGVTRVLLCGPAVLTLSVAGILNLCTRSAGILNIYSIVPRAISRAEFSPTLRAVCLAELSQPCAQSPFGPISFPPTESGAVSALQQGYLFLLIRVVSYPSHNHIIIFVPP